MMRQIKFRGMRLLSKKWVYGSLVEIINLHVMGGVQRFIIPEDTSPRMVEVGGTACQIDGALLVTPETVGEFTGLLDKNGKEIYEGDLVTDFEYFYENAVVEYYEKTARYILRLVPTKGFIDSDTMFDNCTVVGNVHEHPELLKGD
jgi:uncharacterized phage protein (TIGR01671 family)